MKVFKQDVIVAVGPTQLCAGQQAGCEAAVHSVVDNFEQENDCDGVLQIDASNAFNSLNRNVMLHNVKIICTVIAQITSTTLMHFQLDYSYYEEKKSFLEKVQHKEIQLPWRSMLWEFFHSCRQLKPKQTWKNSLYFK